MKKTLVVVDYQHDFCNPNGSLYVNGAEKLEIKLSDYIKEFDNVVFTLDWHPTNHCSFKANGGLWPEHCVNYTLGASVPGRLIASADENCESVTMYKKGYNPNKEEYGAFGELTDESLSRTVDGVEPKTLFDTSDEIVVCGLAWPYCVKETISNLVNAGYKVKAKKELVGFLGEEESFDKELNNIGVDII